MVKGVFFSSLKLTLTRKVPSFLLPKRSSEVIRSMSQWNHSCFNSSIILEVDTNQFKQENLFKYWQPGSTKERAKPIAKLVEAVHSYNFDSCVNSVFRWILPYFSQKHNKKVHTNKFVEQGNVCVTTWGKVNR